MATPARPLDAPDRASVLDTAPRQWVAGLLGRADIRIDGARPWDMQLHDHAALDRALSEGNLGLGEAYMAGAWDCERLDMFFDHLLHSIGKNLRDSVPDRWIDRHVFPNGDLPSIGQVGDALDGLFVCEDLHNFGADYDPTLMAWHANFEAAWPRFAGELGETFRRKWRYYLLSCAGAFRARELQLWQWVLSKDGVRGGWRRPA